MISLVYEIEKNKTNKQIQEHTKPNRNKWVGKENRVVVTKGRDCVKWVKEIDCMVMETKFLVVSLL